MKKLLLSLIFLILTGCLKISIGSDDPDNPPQESICPDQPKTALTSKNTETIVLTDQPLNSSKQVTSTKMVGYTFNAQTGQKLELSIDDDVCQWLYAPDGQLITNNELTQTGQYTLQLSTIKGSKTVNINMNFAENVVGSNSTAIAPAPSTPTVVSHCFEVAQKTGNCANAKDLAEIFIRLVQPEFYPEEKQFKLRENDRIFLLEMLSKTPQEVGLNYENTFCRFLDPLGKKIANNQGILLNKCGIGLFTHSFVDSSFLETDLGQKYYIIMAVNPPNQISKTEAINWFNLIAELILKADL